MYIDQKQGVRVIGNSGDDVPLPLSRIQPGKLVQIVDLDAGRELWTRLESMGVFPCAEVTVLANHNHGPLLLALGDSRIMLGRGMADKVIVQPIQRL
jgi:ferrous iron transport protein A